MTTHETLQDITFSLHGQRRLQQRGISHTSVRIVLQHGHAIHKQSLLFFHLTKSRIRLIGIKDTDGLSNLIVITDLRQKEILTCYKSHKAIHRIKKKPKRLRKNQLGKSGSYLSNKFVT